MKLTESARAFAVFRGASRLLMWAGIGAWFAYCALVMSWAGRRPLQPDPPFTLPFQDHGTLFVSLADLQFSHRLLLAAGLLMALGLIAYFAQRLWPEGRAEVAKLKAEEHARWLARQQRR